HDRAGLGATDAPGELGHLGDLGWGWSDGRDPRPVSREMVPRETNSARGWPGRKVPRWGARRLYLPASRVLFQSATRSALAAMAASTSPSSFTDLILSPCLMLSTTSMPSSTLPNTVCLPFNHGHGTWVMKNWLPLVPGPALAIESTPRSWDRPLEVSSSKR